MYHHHSQQEGPPQPFSNRPHPFNHQEQAHQQQQQHHSHFQYPPIKGSRDTDMEPMNMDIDMYLDRMNGSGSGSFSSSPQRVSESQPGHQRVVLERVVLDWSNYQHPDQTFSSPPSTVTQQPQSSNSASGMQAWMHEPPSPQTRGSHSGVGDGQGVRERAGSILASFGLSSQDLEVLSQYPEDQITPDKLPYIIQDMLSRKSNHQNIAASSSSSYSQSATLTVRETPPPSCSHGSLGRRRSPEVSGICIDYGHSSRTTIDYGHSSLPTIVSSSREAFIREPLSCESLSDTERKKLKRPPASSLPKQEMDVAPERWQFCPQPPVPNKHGDLDYCESSSTCHKSKRSPTPERLLPPRSRHPDPDYRRDSPKRSPSSETQRDYSSSSRHPAPWSSLSKPRDDTKRLPTPSICDYSAESPKDWIDHVESVKHTESYRDLHNNSFSAHMAGGGGGGGGGGEEPPQLALDKARLEKEYLSLMAELGEEPVFFSGGGHNDNQGGGGGGNDKSHDQPPPESPDKDKDIPTAPTAKEEDSIPKDPDYPEILYSNGKVIGYHCKLCHVRVETMNDTEVDVHFKSKDHQVKWIRRLKSLIKSLSKKDKRNAEPHPTIYTSQDERVEEVSSLSKKDPDYPEILYSNGKVIGYHCKLCHVRVETMNDTEVNVHFKSKDHQVKWIRRLKSSIKSLSKKDKRNAEPHATIYTSQDEREELSSLSKKDPDYPEILYSNGKVIGYHCKLCHVRVETMNDTEVDVHFKSKDHQVKWIRRLKSSIKSLSKKDKRNAEPHATIHTSQDERVEEVSSLSKKDKRNAEPDATIHTSQDEHVEEVSSGLRCKLCQCFLPKGAAGIKAHLTGKRHAKHLLLLDPERKPNAPRREQHSLGQDDIPTTRERSATPDDDSASRKPPPSSTELEHSSEDWIDNVESVKHLTIHTSQDEQVEEVSSRLRCKLCQCFLPKGAAAIKAHLTGKRHLHLLLLDPERKPNAPRREQHSLGQDDIPTTRERSATPDDDSVTHKLPPSSTELKDSSEESPDNGKESHTVLTAEEEDSSLKDPDYPEKVSSNGMVIGYHCKLCDIRVDTAKFYQHFMSKKHNVLLIQSQSLRSLYLAKYRDNLEDICRAESIVVVNKNPLTVSHCELCKSGFPDRVTEQGISIPEHLNGQQHVTSLWNKMKSSIGKDGTAGKAPRFSAHIQERHLQELYLEIEANLGKKYNINAAEHDAMINIYRDEHIEEVSSDGKVVRHCKLCQSFLPKGAPINSHLMGKRHVVSLRQLEERRKEESLAESEELHRSEAAGKELSGIHSQAEVEETENVEQMEEDEEEETAASVSVKRLMSDDKRREEEPMQKKQKTHADNPPPPFDPNSADDGMEFLVPKPGFFCQVCNSFFSVEQESQRNHCKSLEHNTNLQKYLQSRKTSS